MSEKWLPVVGFEGYLEVSDQGRVRSLDRVTMIFPRNRPAYARVHRGRILKTARHPRGYMYITLNGGGKTRRNAKVHHVVLEAFVGPKPPGQESCHRNDIPDDNRIDNLRWDTPESNLRDKVENGHSRRTHCKRNHEFTPRNSMQLKGGGRRCRKCHYMHIERRRGTAA